MKYENLGNNTAKFNFEITTELFEQGLDYAYEQIKENVEIKGFRKGKAPRSVYVSHNTVQPLYEDALNFVISNKFEEALKVEELTIVSQPEKIDIDFEKLEAGEAFNLSFEVALKPEVVLGEYKNLKIAKPDTEVSEDELNHEVEHQLSHHKTLVVKEENHELSLNDTAVFDFEGYRDGKPFEGGAAQNYELEIGSNQFIPGFETQMLGMKAGEEKTIALTFPEDYHAEELKGQAVEFKVNLHEIKESVTPELNDDFVASLNIDNVLTVDQYKAHLKNNLIEQKEKAANDQKTAELLKLVVENAKMDIPQAMIDQEANYFKKRISEQAKQYNLDLKTFLMFSGLDEEQFEQQAIEQATRRVSESLVIEQVVKAENITATPDEIVKEYEKLAEQYQMPVDEIKKHINDELVSNDVTFQKALDLILNTAIYE